MDATTVVAIYAAVVATGAAAVQVAAWLGTRTVESAHRVKVASFGAMRVAGGENNFAFHRPYPVHEPLPLVIPERDSKTIWVSRESLPDDERLKFVIRTTAEDDFESKPVVLSEAQRWTVA